MYRFESCSQRKLLLPFPACYIFGTCLTIYTVDRVHKGPVKMKNSIILTTTKCIDDIGALSLVILLHLQRTILNAIIFCLHRLKMNSLVTPGFSSFYGFTKGVSFVAICSSVNVCFEFRTNFEC